MVGSHWQRGAIAQHEPNDTDTAPKVGGREGNSTGRAQAWFVSDKGLFFLAPVHKRSARNSLMQKLMPLCGYGPEDFRYVIVLLE